jgi:hypothetical protein
MLSSLSSSLNNARTSVAQVLNFALVCVAPASGTVLCYTDRPGTPGLPG